MGELFAEPEPSAEQSPADSEVPASAEDAALAAVAQEKAARRRKKRADRKLCLDALPQIEHHHDVSDEEKVCGECQRDKTCIGEEISRVLDFVPGQLEVHNHHLKKYACTCGQCGVTTAPVPLKPIEKCVAVASGRTSPEEMRRTQCTISRSAVIATGPYGQCEATSP